MRAMSGIIVKLGGLYCEWASSIDAPRTYFMPRREFMQYLRARYCGDAERDIAERMKRVEERGTSSMLDASAEEVVAGNRAGVGESELSVEELLAQYVPAPERERAKEMPAPTPTPTPSTTPTHDAIVEELLEVQKMHRREVDAVLVEMLEAMRDGHVQGAQELLEQLASLLAAGLVPAITTGPDVQSLSGEESRRWRCFMVERPAR